SRAGSHGTLTTLRPCRRVLKIPGLSSSRRLSREVPAGRPDPASSPENPLERSSPGPTFRDDVDDDHASLLSGLDVTIGIGDRGERISAVDDRNESARFNLLLESGHELTRDCG